MTSTAPLVVGIEEAEQLSKKGDPGAAFEAYQQVLRIRFQSAEDLSAADMVALERFADLAVLLGRTEAAMESLSIMADLFGAAGNAYGEDYAALKAVLAAHQNGQLRRALALFYSRTERFGDIDGIPFDPAASSTWEATVRWPATDADDRAVMFALFYLAASRLAASLGQYGDASRAARRGAVHAARNTPLAQRYAVPLLLAETLSAVQSGELNRASELLNEVGGQIDARRDPGFNFQFLELSAKLAMLRGELGAALDGLNKSVDLAAQWPPQVQVACLQNLAAFQILINQTANAEQTLDRAEAGTVADVRSRERISRLRVMADLRARSFVGDSSHSISSMWEDGDEAAAVAANPAPQIDESSDQPADFLEWFEQRTLDLQLALGEGRLSLAARMLIAINQTFERSDSEVVHLRMAYLDALLAYYQGQYSRAQATLAVLLPPLERSGLLHDLWQARRLAGWIARRVHASRTAVDDAVTREHTSLQQLAASLDPVSRAIFLLNKWTTDEEAIASLADAAIRVQDERGHGFVLLRWWRSLQCWRRALAVENRLEAGKRALVESAIGAPLRSTRSVGLLDLWRLSRGEAYVTFSALPDRLIAIVRSRGFACVHMLEVSRIALRRSVTGWHERLLDLSAAPGSRPEPLRVALAGILSDLPATVRELRIRPDDALHGYPFAALLIDGVPLIERYTITLGHPGGRRRSATQVRTAVVMAADQPLSGYDGLPRAADEVVVVGDLLSGFGLEVTRLTGTAATKAAAATALGSAAIVHVACHGRFQSEQPSRTGLVLAGPDGSAATLSMTDIGRIDGSRLEHVTLSACWSADNFVVPGRWILSLPETLCRAGAHSVLASLWEADDRIAGAFMQRFYANLARLSRAEALREVQLACLHNQLCLGIDTSDPIFWAGFYLFGDYRRLRCN